MSADAETATGPPVTEYRRHRPESRPAERDDVEAFRREYGRVRGYLKRRQARFGRYQRWLSQARLETTYDVYLARTVVLAANAFVGAGLLATVLLVVASWTGSLAPSLPIGAGIVALTAVVAGGAIGGGRYYYPHVRAYRRGREIDVMFPHAVVFMRAQSEAGRDPIEVIRELADAGDVYGEVAAEFDRIRTDVEVFKDGLPTAVANASELTPSDMLGEFFEDLGSVLESGGDVDAFFEQQSSQQLARTEANLEETLEALLTLAQAYLVLVFIGPLLLLMVLLLVGVTGPNPTTSLDFLTYVAIPGGIVASAVAVHVLTRPYTVRSGGHVAREEGTEPSPESAEPWFEDYREAERRHRLTRVLRTPVRLMRRQPLYSLGASVPLALGFLLLAVFAGVLEPSWESYAARPVRFTAGFVVIPLLVLTIPLMGFHEGKRRRERRVESRMPDVLHALASANARGVTFADSIALVARRYHGAIGEEFSTVRRDMAFDNAVGRALTAFANRLRIPRVSMVVSVLEDVVTVTDDLSGTLEVLGRDLDTRLTLQRTRRREMATYLVVVVLGILVFLLVVLVLDVFFLRTLVEIPVPPTPSGREVPIFAEAADLTLYRRLFFHAALVQAFGNGLLMGKLFDDSLLSGLKYANGLVAVVLLAFAGLFLI